MTGLFSSNDMISSSSFAVFDLETTGLDVLQDDILEIAIHELKDGRVKNKFHSYIFSEKDIRPRITSINKIDKDKIEASRKCDDVLEEVISLYGNLVFVAHNCFGFDAKILMAKRPDLFSNITFLDTKELASDILDGSIDSFSMTSLSDHLGIKIIDQHTANGDVSALCSILSILLARMNNAMDISKYTKKGFQLAKK